MELDLGDEVKDSVTGFTGIATAVTIYLNRTTLVEVTDKQLLDGKPLIQYFDESRLEILKKCEYIDDEQETN